MLLIMEFIEGKCPWDEKVSIVEFSTTKRPKIESGERIELDESCRNAEVEILDVIKDFRITGERYAVHIVVKVISLCLDQEKVMNITQ